MPTAVPTVRGDVAPDRLGRTLIHEHVQFGYPGSDGDRTMWRYDEDLVLDRWVRALTGARGAGFTTIFDLTPNDCGRDPLVLRRAAEAAGIAIVAATGYYYEGAGAPAYFTFRGMFTDIVAELADLFVSELTVGIRDTGIRAGVMKVGSSAGRTTDYEAAIMRAAARAQQATGAPILTHTQAGTMGPEQARLLLDAGADPAKVVIGHMCGSAHDLDYQRAVLSYGVGVGFDRIGTNGLFNDITDDLRLDTLTTLRDEGWANRLFLAHDSVTTWLGRDVSGFTGLPGAAHWSMDRIPGYVIPGLQSRGWTAEQVDGLFVDNVRRLWEA